MNYRSCVCALIALTTLVVTAAGEEFKLIGPTEVEVNRPFEVSVQGLQLPLSTLQAAPPQITWLVLCGEVQIKQRLELLVTMQDGKPAWSAAPYATFTALKPAKLAVVLTVDTAGGFARQAALEVQVGPFPDPNPNPDPPPPPGKRWVILVEESSQRSAEMAVLLTSLKRSPPFKTPEWFRLIDKDRAPGVYVQYVQQCAGSYPRLFVVDETGRVAYEGPCPLPPAEFAATIRKAGG